MGQDYCHIPVMVAEVLEGLQVRPGGRYVDATVGEGGHAQAILAACQPGGEVLGIDADASAIEVAGERLKDYGRAYRGVVGNFVHIGEICHGAGFRPVHGVLFDLGLSSRQLSDGSRGFSFQRDGPLDMRFGLDQSLSATDVVNTWSQEELARDLRAYGQEPRSRQIAQAIVASRPIRTTLELAGVIQRVARGTRGKIHPATRTFQALRIRVNQELENLKAALAQTIDLLASGGRLAVISYHSLEARIVKEFFRRESLGCICPPGTPVCVCSHTPTMMRVTKRALATSAAEVKANPRSRSARLRVGERIL
ncbi:MAG: 16S rRNA (cytosine(1402)-N(4))-methyltransferase RsmH [Dehalococcoidia bacterium]